MNMEFSNPYICRKEALGVQANCWLSWNKYEWFMMKWHCLICGSPQLFPSQRAAYEFKTITALLIYTHLWPHYSNPPSIFTSQQLAAYISNFTSCSWFKIVKNHGKFWLLRLVFLWIFVTLVLISTVWIYVVLQKTCCSDLRVLFRGLLRG